MSSVSQNNLRMNTGHHAMHHDIPKAHDRGGHRGRDWSGQSQAPTHAGNHREPTVAEGTGDSAVFKDLAKIFSDGKISEPMSQLMWRLTDGNNNNKLDSDEVPKALKMLNFAALMGGGTLFGGSKDISPRENGAMRPPSTPVGDRQGTTQPGGDPHCEAHTSEATEHGPGANHAGEHGSHTPAAGGSKSSDGSGNAGHASHGANGDGKVEGGHGAHGAHGGPASVGSDYWQASPDVQRQALKDIAQATGAADKLGSLDAIAQKWDQDGAFFDGANKDKLSNLSLSGLVVLNSFDEQGLRALYKKDPQQLRQVMGDMARAARAGDIAGMAQLMEQNGLAGGKDPMALAQALAPIFNTPAGGHDWHNSLGIHGGYYNEGRKFMNAPMNLAHIMVENDQGLLLSEGAGGLNRDTVGQALAYGNGTPPPTMAIESQDVGKWDIS